MSDLDELLASRRVALQQAIDAAQILLDRVGNIDQAVTDTKSYSLIAGNAAQGANAKITSIAREATGLATAPSDTIDALIVDAAKQLLLGMDPVTQKPIGYIIDMLRADPMSRATFASLFRNSVYAAFSQIASAEVTTQYDALWRDAAGSLLLGMDPASQEPVGYIVDRLRANAITPAAFSGLNSRTLGPALLNVRESAGAQYDAFIIDGGQRLLLGMDVTTQEPAGHMVDRIVARASGGASGGSPTIALAQADRCTFLTAGWNGNWSYGQSLSIGAQGQPVLSTSQPYANLTFSGGVKSSSAADQAATAPLIEDTKGENNATGTNRGETICSSASNHVTRLALIENGIAPTSAVIFAGAPGQGGTAIAGLSKGSGPYNRFIAQVTAAKVLADAAGKPFAVHAVPYKNGETDADGTTTRAAWTAALVQLQVDLDTDIRAITGQTTPVHLLLYQTAYKAASTAGRIALAQMDAVAQSSRIHFVGPIYHLPYNADGTHLTNIGYHRAGRADGRAYKQLVIDGRKPDCIWPIVAWITGLTAVVRFRVPRFPLVLDAATLAATAQHGFVVRDDTGTIALSNVRVGAGGDTIEMTLARAPGANPRVRYALDALGAGLTLSGGASGNLRDSTPGTYRLSGNTYPLYHVAPAFELVPTILEDA